MIEAAAPGKLLICGEYAVLRGAPAIAMAVDVRARARIRTGVGTPHLAVPGTGSWEFRWQANGQPRWLTEPAEGQGRVLEAVLAALAARRLLPGTLPAMDIELDSRAFYVSGDGRERRKLGLGSSAAVTVAAARALLAAFGSVADEPLLLELCLDAHRQLQGGAGSGIDVVAAVYGGVVGVAGSGPGVLPLAWPEGLHWLAAWSGCSASTPEMLQRFAAFEAGETERFRENLQGLSARARTVLDCWRRAAVPEILAAIDAYGESLRHLDASGRIGIWTAEHERLAAVAREAGAIYKTSGAGGGDFGIAFAADHEVVRRLQARLAGQGILTLTATSAAAGDVL